MVHIPSTQSISILGSSHVSRGACSCGWSSGIGSQFYARQSADQHAAEENAKEES